MMLTSEYVTSFFPSGALDEGFPMSHVDFKKWQCRIYVSVAYFLQCHKSNLRNDYVPCQCILSPHVTCH